jgi:hypothetical protein
MSGSRATSAVLAPAEREIYVRALRCLADAGVPHLVGGAYAFAHYTGVVRHTKDFDTFLRREHFEPALAALAAAGFRVERSFPHWLGKAFAGEVFIDVIFSSGNGIARVDDAWFAHAPSAEVFGEQVRLVPVEEMIWSKSFIMERERFDGADIAHLLLHNAEHLDWARLRERCGPHWRVLLAHLVLFGFIYPAMADRLPRPLLAELIARLAAESTEPATAERVCRGTILSRAQYLHDIECAGYRDARLRPLGGMSAEEIAIWTAAIGDSVPEPPVLPVLARGGGAGSPCGETADPVSGGEDRRDR